MGKKYTETQTNVVSQKNPMITEDTGPGQTVIGSKSMEMLINRFRAKLASRGARGIIGLQRTFKIMDDNNSKTLDQQEFTKGI